MNNLRLVIEREFYSRVRKRSFWVMTILFPFLMLAIGAVPILLSQDGSDSQRVAVIDHTGKYIKLFQDSQAYSFVTADRPISEYKGKNHPEEITAILEIRQDLLEDPSAISLFSFKQPPRPRDLHQHDSLQLPHGSEDRLLPDTRAQGGHPAE